MKRIKYEFSNNFEGALKTEIYCGEDIFDECYAIAEREAIGSIDVEEVDSDAEI